MSVIGEDGRTVLTYYNLPTPYPVEWPAELDESDDEEDEIQRNMSRRKSRYSALERSASDRRTSILPNSQKTNEGKANLVQKDEADPLGAGSSVVTSLQSRGIPVEQDVRLRNKFLLSSTTFSPALFLSQAHSDDSTDDLVRGLRFLSKSIDQKSASLKVLVETNFERFVRAKATIDNVYTEMRNQGVDPESARPSTPRHSRQFSRQSNAHMRNFSGASTGGTQPPSQAASKNALRKETEYGVLGIKAPLLEVSQKAEDVWGPALGGKEREGNLKSLAQAVEQDRLLYELGSSLNEAIKQNAYDKIVAYYNSARKYADQAKILGQRAMQDGRPLTDDQIYKILVTGRMWTDVEDQIQSLKRDIWKRLTTVPSTQILPGAGQDDQHLELISILLELGVDDNPISFWLMSRYDYLKNKIAAVVERSKIEIEVLRRRLASVEPPSSQSIAKYIRLSSKETVDNLDSETIIDFWKTLMAYLTKLLSKSNGLLGEVMDFWDAAQSFIDGNKQRSMPMGFAGESRKHHRLSEPGIKLLQEGAVELVSLLKDAVHSLFVDPPTDDISTLFSPASNSARSPSGQLTTGAFSPTEGRVGNLDPQNLPGLSPKKGEVWEDFAFWPPHSTALSAVHYLGKALVLIGTAAGEMGALRPLEKNDSVHEKLKTTVGASRERCMRAVCEAWGKDAESCKSLEDWIKAPERHDQTMMPTYFVAFEKKILSGMEQILYFSVGITQPGARDIITPPPSKLLQMVRTQFVSSIQKAVSGMLENAETPIRGEEDEWIVVTNSDLHSLGNAESDELTTSSIDASDRNVRMLLMLSNLKVLRNEYIPQLIQLFESSFSVKLTDESKSIRDMFGQADSQIFQSYSRPMASKLNKTIKDGINSPDWIPASSKPDQVHPYVYAALMILVNIHTEVSTSVANAGSSGPLLSEILTYFLETVSQALLDSFKDREPNTYPLPALMQATLDTEFIAQTMSQYSSQKASTIQAQIYRELDKRTTNDARKNLQSELGDMRVVLKKLREQSRNSFGCFKKQRSGEKPGKGRPERVERSEREH